MLEPMSFATHRVLGVSCWCVEGVPLFQPRAFFPQTLSFLFGIAAAAAAKSLQSCLTL